MRRRRGILGLLVGLCVAAASCSGGSTADPTALAQEPASTCEATAASVTDLLVEFVAPYRDLTPQAFLAEPELEGIDDFRTDVAGLLVNENCNAEVFNELLDDRLRSMVGENLLTDFLVNSIRTDRAARVTRDVVVEPGDDLAAVINSLGSGSTITLSEGTHDVEATLIVEVDLVVQGASRDSTQIRSTAGDAAIAVFGDGRLDLRDVAVIHQGPKRSSGVLAFGAPIEIRRARISGAAVDDQGVGGAGVLVSGSQILDPDGEPLGSNDSPPVVIIVDSEIVDNEFAGIVVAGSLNGSLEGNRAANNGGCGICFFDGASGFAQQNTIENNQLGIQVSGDSSPDIAQNEIVDNEIAGVLIDGAGTAAIFDNDVAGNGEAGVDVQGDGEPLIAENRFDSQPFSLSLRGSTRAVVRDNEFGAGEVGLLVAEQAQPTVTQNEFRGQSLAALQHEGASSGAFSDNAVFGDVAGENREGVGVLVRGTATPTYGALSVTGGSVGVFAGEGSAPSFGDASLTGQLIGLQVGESAAPTFSDGEISSSDTSGVLWAGDGGGEFVGSMIVEPPEIALQIGGSTTVHIIGNEVDGGVSGLLVIDDAQPVVEQNTFRSQEFGIGVSDRAAPLIRDNEIAGSTQVAISFEGAAEGEFSSNRLVDVPLVGVRVTGDAAPTISNNQLAAVRTETPGDGRAVGLLFDDAAQGTAASNSVYGFAIGLQISGSAAPALVENTIDGASVGVAGFLYSGQAAGEARDNTTLNQPIGFQATGDAYPAILRNTVESATAAAFLMQGQSTPILEDNACPNGAATGIAVLENAVPELRGNQCAVARQ